MPLGIMRASTISFLLADYRAMGAAGAATENISIAQNDALAPSARTWSGSLVTSFEHVRTASGLGRRGDHVGREIADRVFRAVFESIE
jgi:hypothetical protein